MGSLGKIEVNGKESDDGGGLIEEIWETSGELGKIGELV